MVSKNHSKIDLVFDYFFIIKIEKKKELNKKFQKLKKIKILQNYSKNQKKKFKFFGDDLGIKPILLFYRHRWRVKYTIIKYWNKIIKIKIE